MSDSVRETNSGMREGTRKDGEGEREAAIVGNGRIEGYGEHAGAGGAGSDVDEQSLPNSRIVGISRTPCLTIYALLCKAGISERAIIPWSCHYVGNYVTKGCGQKKKDVLFQ